MTRGHHVADQPGTLNGCGDIPPDKAYHRKAAPTGLTQKGIATFYKYLNNPNRAIEKMFKMAEKLP